MFRDACVPVHTAHPETSNLNKIATPKWHLRRLKRKAACCFFVLKSEEFGEADFVLGQGARLKRE